MKKRLTIGLVALVLLAVALYFVARWDGGRTCCAPPTDEATELPAITAENMFGLQKMDSPPIEGVIEMAWLQDSDMLVNLDNDELIRFSLEYASSSEFDTALFGPLQGSTGTFGGHLSINEAGTLAAVIGKNRVGIWGTSSGSLDETLDLESAIFSSSVPEQIAFLPSVHPWSPADNQAGANPKGDEILTRNDGEIAIWDSEDGSQHWSEQVAASYFSVGKHGIAYIVAGQIYRSYDTPNFEMFNTSSRIGEAQSLSFSPDGEALAVIAVDGTLSLWKASDGSYIDILEAEQAIQVVTFSHSGDLLLGGGLGELNAWRVSTGELLKTFVVPEMAIRILAFSQDDKRLAVGLAPMISGPLEIDLQLWGIVSEVYSGWDRDGFSFYYPLDGERTWAAGEYGIPMIDFPVEPGTALQAKYVMIQTFFEGEGCSEGWLKGEPIEEVFGETRFLVWKGVNGAMEGASDHWELYETNNGQKCVSLYFVLTYAVAPEILDNEAADRAFVDQILSTFRWD